MIHRATWIALGFALGALAAACGGTSAVIAMTTGPASDITYDNSASGLSATNVQAVLDELAQSRLANMFRVDRDVFSGTNGVSAGRALGVVTRDGVLSNLVVRPAGTPTPGARFTASVTVNGTPVALAVTHDATLNTSEFAANTIDVIPVSRGDVIRLRGDNVSGTSTGTPMWTAIEFR